MTDELDDISELDRLVNKAVAAYLSAVDKGETPDTGRFLADHSEIERELRSFLEDRRKLDQMTRAFPLMPATQQFRGDVGASRAPFGDYELLQEIARGGMGIVFKARQLSLNRVVALKMILAGPWASDEDIQRLHREAQAVARLDHPGIVPIFEVGEHDGQHFFSMGFVEGPNLSVRMQQGRISPQQAAELLREVCDAVQYAHDHGVVHRDLKPANILLDEGNVSRPRVTDFGLAKQRALDPGLTNTGQILGTPAYMSPEQAVGRSERVGPRSDVYSLGAILYEVLTGQPPHVAATPLATISQVLEADPVSPRHLNRSVPAELEAICLKCLEKDPKRRYSSARELGDDLRRYLEGDPIRAPGVLPLDRIRRVFQRSRHEEHFRGWGLGLTVFGWIILLSHLAIFLFGRTALGPWWAYFLPRTVMFGLLLVAFRWFRPQSLLPVNSAERLVWVVWIAYLAAIGSINVTQLVRGRDLAESYPIFAAMAGLGFLVMGGHVWGGGYIAGVAFLAIAPLMPFLTDMAPIAVGVLWAASLFAFGIHYRRRGLDRLNKAEGES